MTLEEIDEVLPNGFHDARIAEFTQNYVNASLRLKISVVIGLREKLLPMQTDAETQKFYSRMFCFVLSRLPIVSQRSGLQVLFGSDLIERSPDCFPKRLENQFVRRLSAIPSSYWIGCLTYM